MNKEVTKKMITKNVLVMAGGTGGHIFPAMSVATELENRGYHVSWLGSKGGMEEELLQKESFTLFLLPVKGLRGKGVLELLKAPYRLLVSIVQSIAVIRGSHIDLVIGFGGFASGPGGIAAWLTRKSLIIHEQNAIAGTTNKILSRFAVHICQAFPNVFQGRHVTTTGNPLRQSIIDAAQNSYSEKSLVSDTKKLRILVVGGSRGAHIFNEVLPSIFSRWLKEEKIKVTHQSGKHKKQFVIEQYQSMGINTETHVDIKEFIDDMHTAYVESDLVICRSGALTVSEIAAFGKVAVFVPYPYAVDDHQTKNAEYLSQHSAAYLIPQKNIEQIQTLLNELVENSICLSAMAKTSKTMANLNATHWVADICEKTIREKAA